jgi:hypothetical protein
MVSVPISSVFGLPAEARPPGQTRCRVSSKSFSRKEVDARSVEVNVAMEAMDSTQEPMEDTESLRA